MIVILLFLVAAAVAAAVGVHKVVRHRVKHHGWHLLAWRWISGQPWHGKPLTDAGWSRPGTRALTETGHARRLWYLPQRKRAARRAVRTLAVLLAAWGLILNWQVTVQVAGVCSLAGTGYGIFRAVRWQQQRKHTKTWMYPAHLVAAPLAGIAVTADPASWLTVDAERTRVKAELPSAYNGDEKARARLVETLSKKLAIESPEVRWQLAGPKPSVELTQSKPPPKMVKLADVLTVIEGAKPDELVWGLGKKSQVVKSSLSGDSPHIGLSMGSGAGKSVTARSLLAQQLHKGSIGMVLDPKMISHHWARELPNVVIYRKPAEIHRALIWLDAELSRRTDVVLAAADDDGRIHAVVGPRIFVVFEEMNAAISLLRGYWREERDKSDPARSPALDALDRVSFMGRQVLCNILYIGQRLSDKATGGGGDARENIGVIALARYRPSTWKMLVPDLAMPPKDLTPGRLHVVSDQVQTAQGIFMSTAEAKELALSGVVAQLPHNMPGTRRATAEPAVPETARTGSELALATVSAPPVPDAVTLREAVEAGLLSGLTLAGARTARHRDDTFPRRVGRDGVAELYDPEALARWAAARNEVTR